MSSTSRPNSPNPEQGTFFLDVIYLLGQSGYEDDAVESSPQAYLEAVEKLVTAPHQDHLNRALLLGLRHRHAEVVNATVAAVIKRLNHLPSEVARSDFIGLILDACFLNLTGRSPGQRGSDAVENERIRKQESAAGHLFRAVTKELCVQPLQYEHHISRVLARARQLDHMEGTGELARAVVAFQKQLGEDGQRLYQQDAEALQRRRKFNVYESPDSADAALVAHLDQDRKLDTIAVSQDLIGMYRIFLNVQTKTRPLLLALDNLIKWLGQIPQPGSEQWSVFFQDMVGKARINVPWPELNLHVVRHLELQLEILPGKNHPEDILRLLRTKYAAPEQEAVLIKGLKLLQRFPLVRNRIDELIEFAEERGKTLRSVGVWRAFIELAAAHITGLEDLVPTKSEDVLSDKERRRLRIMEKTLAVDKKLRALLFRLATDERFVFTKDPDTERVVRETAWRRLLRCLPLNRTDLYRRGVFDFGQRFFLATLEEAETLGQRGLWQQLLPQWDRWFGNHLPPEVRGPRLRAVGSFFEKTRPFQGVCHDGERPGPMIRFALDDPDQEIREFCRQKVINASFGEELRKEALRREILQNREFLTQSNEQVIQSENDISETNRQLVEERKQKVVHALQVQELLEVRDLMVTDGWISTAHCQVDLEEVREQLAEVLAEAQRQYQVIQNLQRQIANEVAESRRVRNSIRSLVAQQEQQEELERRLGGELADARQGLLKAERNLESTKREIGNLEHRSPARPTGQGDPEANRRAADAYRREVNRIQSKIKHLDNRRSNLRGEMDQCRSNISHCESGIERAQVAHQKLQQEINRTRQAIDTIHRRIERIRNDYRAGLSTWRALRAEIDRLNRETQNISRRSAQERECLNERLRNNGSSVDAQQRTQAEIHRRIQILSNQLNGLGENLDRQTIRSRQLMQAIDSGRKDYDETGKRAVQTSAHADSLGDGLEKRESDRVSEDQNSRVHISKAVERALRGKKVPTRTQRRQLRQSDARRRRRST